MELTPRAAAQVRVYSGRGPAHKPLAVLSYHLREAAAVAWAAPGAAQQLVWGREEEEGEEQQEEHQERVLGVLASGSRDTSVALWRVAVPVKHKKKQPRGQPQEEEG